MASHPVKRRRALSKQKGTLAEGVSISYHHRRRQRIGALLIFENPSLAR